TFDASTGNSVQAEWIDYTTAHESAPSIASDNESDTFMVTVMHKNAGGLKEVHAYSILASNLAMSPSVLVGDAGSQWNNVNADIGGKGHGFSMFKVVWQRDFGGAYQAIRSRVIYPLTVHSTTNPPVVGTLESVGQDTLANYTNPRISKSTGDDLNSDWRIVFMGEIIATGRQAIHSALYAETNAVRFPHAPLYSINPSYTLHSV
ncbi:MAG: hypothetical protein GY762_05835, partial [Proteobacteria bacterium]|nr:hypothetical protein [Pseudomonadota bacterium]